jgi:hypothetical protein
MALEGAHGVPGSAQEYRAPSTKPSRWLWTLSAGLASRIGLLSLSCLPSAIRPAPIASAVMSATFVQPSARMVSKNSTQSALAVLGVVLADCAAIISSAVLVTSELSQDTAEAVPQPSIPGIVCCARRYERPCPTGARLFFTGRNKCLVSSPLSFITANAARAAVFAKDDASFTNSFFSESESPYKSRL